MRTSKDDEYLMVLLVTHYGNNQIGHNQFATKAVRALKRSPAFVASTFRNAMHVILEGKPTVAFQVDDDRFNRVMDKIVRAIHFDATGRKLGGPVILQSTAFRKFDPPLERDIAHLGLLGRTFLSHVPAVGDNPDAFLYQIAPTEKRSGGVMRLVFYGGFEVFATWGLAVDEAAAT